MNLMAADVALISMPVCIYELGQASLGVPIITASLKRNGIDCVEFYPNLTFINIVRKKYPTVDHLSHNHSFHMGINAVFSKIAFGLNFEKNFLKNQLFIKGDELDYISDDTRVIEFKAFLDDLLNSNDWSSHKIIGFSCNYYQLIPSIIFARMLKQKNPGITIIFGGSYFEQESAKELLRNEPSIDYIMVGHADCYIADMMAAILAGRSVKGSCIFSQNIDVNRKDEKNINKDDKNPDDSIHIDCASRASAAPIIPYYQERFRQSIGLFSRPPSSIDVEIGRGCEKAKSNPCYFCSERMYANSARKTVEEFREEIQNHNRKLGATQFNINDSFISANDLIKYLEPLRDFGFTFNAYGIFPNVRRTQIEKLSGLGCRAVQLGIESFSNRLLGLMNKRNDVIECINALKWTKHHKVIANYNLLYLVPGERPSDYLEQQRLVRKLHHLDPPKGMRNISGLRQAMFMIESDKHGIKSHAPCCILSELFPDRFDRTKMASEFLLNYEGNGNSEMQIRGLSDAISEWREQSERGASLIYSKSGDGTIKIHDSRLLEEKTITLNIEQSLLLSCLDEPTKISAIRELTGLSDTELAMLIIDLENLDLIYKNESGVIIGLALPA